MASPELLVERLDARRGAAVAPVARAASRAKGFSTLSVLRDLIALTKPRITALVLVTEAAGLGIAPGRTSHVGARALALSLVGTALIVGAANTLNMWWEADTDARMERTRNRPLPAGRLSSDAALAFGLALAAVSVPMLFLVNLATGLLGLVALVSYVAVYTPLKRHTSMALLVGAVPGAMPPLMGWSTATGHAFDWGPGPNRSVATGGRSGATGGRGGAGGRRVCLTAGEMTMRQRGPAAGAASGGSSYSIWL